jgi:hypothetical protein
VLHHLGVRRWQMQLGAQTSLPRDLAHMLMHHGSAWWWRRQAAAIPAGLWLISTLPFLSAR